MNRYSFPVWLTLATLTPASVPATAAARQPTPCLVQRSGGVLDGPGATFERAIDTSTLIVEATVQATAQGRRIAPPQVQNGPTEIDVTLVATRAIKGTAPQEPFVIARLPATGFFDMQPGQRFILFLGPLDARAAEIYAASPLKNRLRVLLGATLCVDDAHVVHVSAQGNFIRHLDNLPLEKAVGEIATAVGRR